MASNLHYSATLANAQGDAISTTIGASGFLRGYSGTQPANTAASITGTLLFENALSTTAAGATSAGLTTFNTITNDSSANATGTLSHFRIWKSDATTAVMDGSAGTSASDLNMNTVSIVSGGPVAVSSFTSQNGNHP